jgi:small-conductance mechanosensitive channel
MNHFFLKAIESLIVLVCYFVIKKISFRIINKTLSEKFIQESRGVIIRKVVNVILTLISLVFVLLIWGVKQSDLAVLIGSVFTIVGVAFFAQWSLLSNITSGIILFFNHSVKLNDSIIILEGKDYVLEGKIINIGLFFITLETPNTETITLPNNIFILKSVKKIASKSTDLSNTTGNSTFNEE